MWWAAGRQWYFILDQEQLMVCQTKAHIPVPTVCSTSYCSSQACHSISYWQINTLAWCFCSDYHQQKGNIFKLLSDFVLVMHRDELQTPRRRMCFVQVYQRYHNANLHLLKFSFPLALASDYFNAFLNSEVKLNGSLYKYKNRYDFMVRLYMLFS